jgi:hypothetical protein
VNIGRKSVCQSCWLKEERRQLKAEGRCINCKEPTEDGKARCRACRAKDAKAHSSDKDKYRQAKEEGLCCYCRKRKPDDGMASCTECRERNYRNHAKFKAKKRDEQD